LFADAQDISHHKIGRRLRFTDANVAQYERQTLHTPCPMDTTGRKGGPHERQLPVRPKPVEAS
jgi:hypothetical protein